MADAVITEHAGTRQGPVTRFYQYGREGVQVLDTRKNLQRLYIFDPSSDMMTERDPLHREKILRRFVFDHYGMLEETFSFGQSPRTFRYENGGEQIAVREGGQYGAVGKIFTFERNGVAETAWGRHGEIERVYLFESGNDTIMVREDGWFGMVVRTLVFEGIDASVFREPEAFLQFLIFTEWRKGEMESTDQGAAPSRDGSRTNPAGLHLPEKGIHHLIHPQIQKMTSVLTSSRRGIALWRSLMRMIKAGKKAVRYPLLNAGKGITPDFFQRYLGCFHKKPRYCSPVFNSVFSSYTLLDVLREENSAKDRQHSNRDFPKYLIPNPHVWLSPSGTGIPLEPGPEPWEEI